MPAWLPLIKTALPIVADVLKVAIPAFTSKTDDKKAGDIIPEQISELQSAATQNAESVKTLATQLKETIEGIDTAAVNLQQELIFLKRKFIFSMLVAAISFAFAVWAVLSK